MSEEDFLNSLGKRLNRGRKEFVDASINANRRADERERERVRNMRKTVIDGACDTIARNASDEVIVTLRKRIDEWYLGRREDPSKIAARQKVLDGFIPGERLESNNFNANTYLGIALVQVIDGIHEAVVQDDSYERGFSTYSGNVLPYNAADYARALLEDLRVNELRNFRRANSADLKNRNDIMRDEKFPQGQHLGKSRASEQVIDLSPDKWRDA
ncbi:hypothetical protein A2865_03480 [Candidatus Woesebacteria bacterium RIFCSPHIGHO2_01_FULL_39_17]|uniref:Uncharacterized protein n=3 Tax=Candidatus Woeseibacteriota TaxID=1752722 RepID=A0A0G0NDX3_9BACT|nr:MAG: hypothetical protein US72_C0007G0013 [Microgenomates group bacterium GW2011_GWC1_38_12]KKQ93786.1 MAG: hypothetical protein UT19_C0007G0030 [Candidatus Woesebacteria bacterium GW2011_GWB1_39_10b]KKR14349.1 MAG: hypothetical protein UT40_C0002G0028 [Candidatus Woesebacteria bacterium GW2011_GWA1_39_21b]OGM23594.1 MAG: hypothetical protein A2865_03480 [Candidatus Woesebacteria bacterium RIFCSPHIGHO2_01_FULL_39_17]OGM64330.1 MAG: hypothetical protein A3A52_05335 [Candidatus Woesebacteria b